MAEVRRGPAQNAAPSTYELAGVEAFMPEAVTATFDGSGAAGAFLPTLSIYAQSGELLARCPAAEVAAGSSAEVTFAPLLRAAAGGAGPTGATFVPAAFVLGQGNIPVGSAGNYDFMQMTDFWTSDPTVFAQDSFDGVTHWGGILYNQPGVYWQVAASQIYEPGGTEPAASLIEARSNTFVGPATAAFPLWLEPVKTGVRSQGIGGRVEWHPWDTALLYVDPTDPGPPYGAQSVSFQSGATQPMFAKFTVTAWKLSAAAGGYPP